MTKMTPEQFVYWLQGYCELNPDHPPSESQWKMIEAHLKLVFDKQTPSLEKLMDLSDVRPSDYSDLRPPKIC